MPFRREPLLLASSSNAISEPSYERVVVSLDLEKHPTDFKKVRFNDFARSISTPQLRGGADRHHAGRLRWRKRAQIEDQKLGKGNDTLTSEITLKRHEIGPPRVASAPHVLPPASRYVRQTQNVDQNATMVSPLENFYSIHGDQQHCITHHNRTARVDSPPLPPLPALRATPSRSATTNPYARKYGNPNILRAGPNPQPVDHICAGSLVGRPSALDDPQAAYNSLSALRESAVLGGHSPTPQNNTQLNHSGFKSRTHRVWANRKWDALPALPAEETIHLTVKEDTTRRQGDDAQPFDTEEVLMSLRPERLSLYHIDPPGHQMHDLREADDSSAVITARPAQANVCDRRRLVYKGDEVESSDGNSIWTRDWDLQSCNTNDLDIDTRLERQRELARCAQRPNFSGGQWRQENVRDNKNKTLSGLPEKDSATPESIFYNELIRIVKDYHELLQGVIHRAYEAGEMSEDHYLREKWRHRTAMERKLQAAEDMSGYKILTTLKDIKEAVKQPTGYAIYSSLLRIRDPESWQRIFEAISLQPPSTPATIIPPSEIAAESSLKSFARKVGRAFRFMLAIPSNPELKTYSKKYAPPTEPTAYHSPISAHGYKTTSQPTSCLTISHPIPLPSHQLRLTGGEEKRPSTQTERPSKVSKDTTKINGTTVFTGTTIASPLNGRYIHAPRSRGYEQGAYITVVNPSLVVDVSEKTVSGYGVGGLQDWRKNGRERESAVTAWPKGEW
ncbi:hypothetical protein SVAN01_00059 [Stagonosporopsis vannaccii]|nr:hypothetical protein SVAN01_00059 [Stagonosporopsis vannaccii]